MKASLPIVLIVSASLLAGSAIAQIYKYKNEEGKWVFTDRPPEPGGGLEAEVHKSEGSMTNLRQGLSGRSVSGTGQEPQITTEQGAARRKNTGERVYHQPMDTKAGLRGIMRVRDRIARDYKISVEVAGVGGKKAKLYGVSMKPFEVLDFPRAINALNALEIYLKPYPKGFLEASGVERIVLGRNFKAKRLGSAAGFASSQAKGIFLNAEIRTQSFRPTLNHEIFHMIDFTVGKNHKFMKDLAWTSLNARGFRYGYKNYGVSTGGGGLLRFKSQFHPREGFVTRYAMVNAAEDKAEMFESLMDADMALLLRSTATKDRILKRKIEIIEQVIEEISPGFVFPAR